MAEQPTTQFTYTGIERLLQEERYAEAISALSQRIEALPEDRTAWLLLLLANVSQFGTGPFDRQIEEVRLFADLSGNERHIIRQIFLVCFQNAERNGQTIQKIAYQRLIRRLMLNQPLDLSISEARAIEQSEETQSTSVAHAASPWTAASADEAVSEPFTIAPRRIDHWVEYSVIGAGAIIVIVLLGVYVMTGARTPFAKYPERPSPLVSRDSERKITEVSPGPVVTQAPTFAGEATRPLLPIQLGDLKTANARGTDADPTTGETVSLKLKIELSGEVSKVKEAVARLSEQQSIDVVVTDAKVWNRPSGGPTAVSVPTQQAAQHKPYDSASLSEDLATAHTKFVLEEAQPPAPELPSVAMNRTAPKPHTDGPLEGETDIEIAAAPKASRDPQDLAAMKRAFTATSAIRESETEIARTAPLKHEPRFAAENIEEVGLGTRVTVLRKERDWIKVKVQTSGKVGYMRKEYLTTFNSHR